MGNTSLALTFFFILGVLGCNAENGPSIDQNTDGSSEISPSGSQVYNSNVPSESGSVYTDSHVEDRSSSTDSGDTLDNVHPSDSTLVSVDAAINEEDTITQQEIALNAHLEGNSMRLEIDPMSPLWYYTCDLYWIVEKYSDGAWVRLRDDMPGSHYQRTIYNGCMLDGKFVPPSVTSGCDLLICEEIPNGIEVGTTVEYIETGFVPPPDDFDYSALQRPKPESIPVYESQPLHDTRVRTHVTYYTDDRCQDRHKAVLEVAVP